MNLKCITCMLFPGQPHTLTPVTPGKSATAMLENLNTLLLELHLTVLTSETWPYILHRRREHAAVCCDTDIYVIYLVNITMTT